MRSLCAAGALAVNRSGGSQIRSTWQSAEMTSYFIGLPSLWDTVDVRVARRAGDCLPGILADALQRLALFGRQPGMQRIEMHIAGALRHLDHLDEVLGGGADRCRPDGIVGPAALRRVGFAPIALAVL